MNGISELYRCTTICAAENTKALVYVIFYEDIHSEYLVNDLSSYCYTYELTIDKAGTNICIVIVSTSQWEASPHAGIGKRFCIYLRMVSVPEINKGALHHDQKASLYR